MKLVLETGTKWYNVDVYFRTDEMSIEIYDGVEGSWLGMQYYPIEELNNTDLGELVKDLVIDLELVDND